MDFLNQILLKYENVRERNYLQTPQCDIPLAGGIFFALGSETGTFSSGTAFLGISGTLKNKVTKTLKERRLGQISDR